MSGTLVDPLAGSQWSQPGVVAGFSTSAPNPALMHYARRLGRFAFVHTNP